MVADTTIGSVSESDLLARILPLFASSPHAGSGVVVPPGDDAAVLTTGASVVVTTDTMVRGRDWRDDWSDPADVAHKLGAQNISDIAAMGGTATGALMTVAADPSTPLAWVESFAAGLGEWCREAAVAVVGGDLSSAPSGVLQVSLTMWGDLHGRAPVLRSGARPGDVLAVCGAPGWADAGLISYAAGEPDFATPSFIVDAAAEALQNPANYRYTPAAGLPVLREAIAAKTLRDSGLEVAPSHVIVTNGGKQSV